MQCNVGNAMKPFKDIVEKKIHIVVSIECYYRVFQRQVAFFNTAV